MMQPSVMEDTRPNWLPSTWVYYTVTRSNPDRKTFGRVDKYYISPEEKMYRSEKSVKEYLGMPYNSRKSVKRHASATMAMKEQKM
ncbi:hypothetical protein D8674_006622 [Pyrus ussuriensis x Pyrus communis]|uniref:MBD domain-containing protein n=1 Tax=Pyrus ussuriensis x Pyrus communis TaxID=2448454 RepID=A0A5N5FUT7_9ROSA|nr:hypothetical protein D8674_006622 [Pyrus ussuriensis x Pyrus communis]